MGVAMGVACQYVGVANLSLSQVTEEIERFKGQGVEMEEKRRDILRDLEVRHLITPSHTHTHLDA